MTGDFFNSDMANAERAKDEQHFPEKRDPNFAFRNIGDLTFQDVSDQWGLNSKDVSFGASLSDLDGDGDLDLIVNRYNEPANLYRNQSASGNCLKISLRGTASNSYGVGAMVRVETEMSVQVRYNTLARGFMSTNDPVLHFGLGDATMVNKVVVHWPSGRLQSFDNLQVNQHFEIREPTSASITDQDEAPQAQPYFRLGQSLRWRHLERPYDDFAVQPLLPNKLSQLGPGIAVYDVNGDGQEDLYLGGAVGQPGSIALKQGKSFRPSQSAFKTLREDASCEDMGALFFDADGDGDADLYVVSGGVEHGPDSPLLEDRLYINNGNEDFVRAPQAALPALRDSGSCVNAADYDQDGDLDLFVGSRVVPGQYPVSPLSRLLRNDSSSGKIAFVEATQNDAPDLNTVGMVTGSLWSDADNDGDVDLFVTLEWGPVKFFRNDAGKLVDATFEAGLAGFQGWWNGITGCDVDHDGDIDYAVTNFGLNTKYHASDEHPVMVYYGDFEGKGEYQIVEAARHDGALWPVRGRSCSSNAMPTLAQKFETFHEFALADLPSIYTSQCLEKALELSANELRSGILLNNGAGHFEFHALPALVQIAPCFGAEFCFANDDPHPDLFIVQNFYQPQRETGRMDGGLGVVLLGNGKGEFSPVWPDRSGLAIWADAKGLVRLDLNGDAADDFLATVNNGRIRAFHSMSEGNVWRLRLHGPAGNPDGIGAKVSVEGIHGGRTIRHTVERYAGGSYLSQSSPLLSFATGNQRIVEVTIEWPDGLVQKEKLQPNESKPAHVFHAAYRKRSLKPTSSRTK